MPVPSNQRRWQRHPVNIPVRVVAHNGLNTFVPARATEISEGGLALYAGMPMGCGDMAEIEFQTARKTKVLGVVRHRTGYCFGLEFLSPLSSENDVTAGVQWASINLVRVTADVSDKITLAGNGAAAFALLEEVLLTEGKPQEAKQAALKAAALCQQLKEVYSVLQETKNEIRRILAHLEQMPALAAEAERKQLRAKPLTFAAAASSVSGDASRFSPE